MSRIFTAADAWLGGSFAALMFFGRGDFRLAQSIGSALWSCPQLVGPYRDRNSEPEFQSIADVDSFSAEHCEQLVGLMIHPSGNRTPFVHTTVIDAHGLWVYAGPTLGGLALHLDVGAYPMEDGDPVDWVIPLIDELRSITKHVALVVPPKAAVYGWVDVCGLDMIADALKGIIPERRWVGLDIWQVQSPKYLPPTHTSAPWRPL